MLRAYAWDRCPENRETCAVSLVVSLDVLPADSAAEYAPAMVSACTEALPEGRCALSRDLPESAHPQAVALVIWQGESFREVTVRVGQGDGKWVSRHLAFAESDSLSERFTTVGLTAATLVGDSLPQPAPLAPAQPEPEARREQPVPVPQPAPPSPERPFRGQLGALTGPAWLGAEWQRGGWLSLSLKWPRTPLLMYAFGSYGVSAGPGVAEQELRTSWTTGGLGAGVELKLPALPIAVSAAVEVGVRRVHAELGGRSATDWETPLRARGLLAFPADGRLAVTTGGVLRVPPGSSKTSETHARAGFSAELLLGLEVRL